jgi:hypothetical protein
MEARSRPAPLLRRLAIVPFILLSGCADRAAAPPDPSSSADEMAGDPCASLGEIAVTPERTSLVVDEEAALTVTAVDVCNSPMPHVTVVAHVDGANAWAPPLLWGHTGEDGRLRLAYRGVRAGDDEFVISGRGPGRCSEREEETSASTAVRWECPPEGCPPEPELEPRPIDDPATASSEDVEDARWHADDLGVSLAEALGHLELQETVGRFETVAAHNEPEIFGGLSIQYNPYRVEVSTTDLGTTAFHDLTEFRIFSELRGLVVLLPVAFTITELEEAADRFMASAPKVPYELGIDGEVRGCIVVTTERTVHADALRDAIRAAEPPLPQDAFLILDGQELSTPDR